MCPMDRPTSTNDDGTTNPRGTPRKGKQAAGGDSSQGPKRLSEAQKQRRTVIMALNHLRVAFPHQRLSELEWKDFVGAFLEDLAGLPGWAVVMAAKRLRPTLRYFPTIATVRAEVGVVMLEHREEMSRKAIPEWVQDEKMRDASRDDPRVIDARAQINEMLKRISSEKGMP